MKQSLEQRLAIRRMAHLEYKRWQRAGYSGGRWIETFARTNRKGATWELRLRWWRGL